MTDQKQAKPAKNEPNDEARKLREELKTAQAKLDEANAAKEEFKTKYLRALADYQNFENRMTSQRAELIGSANKDLLIRLLPFLDNLEKAGMFYKDPNLKLVTDSFYQTLKGAGLREIEVEGKEYDPNNAEVIDMVEGEKDNVVVEVLRKGYELNGKIIRIAQVKVSRKVEKGN